LLLGLAKPLKEALGRPVCCTLQGEDLFLEGLQEPYKTEALDLIRENIQHVDAFISVSDYYAGFMPDYLNVPREKIRVVPLGINLDGYEPRPRQRSQPFTVGFFARVAPEKGLHVLAEAYRMLRASGELPGARLEAAGYIAPEHKKYLAEIENKMNDAGLAAEFKYHGVLDRDEKIAFLRTLDLLSVPATYDEPKECSCWKRWRAVFRSFNPRGVRLLRLLRERRRITRQEGRPAKPRRRHLEDLPRPRTGREARTEWFEKRPRTLQRWAAWPTARLKLTRACSKKKSAADVRG
jgi:glycosyltransferase involved in cell wall biosynthesis